LKQLRSDSGVKQKDLAVRLGIPASLLSMYEQGKREPSISFLEKFSKYFNVTLSQLFATMEKENSNNKYEPNIDSLLLEMRDLLVDMEKAAQKRLKKENGS